MVNTGVIYILTNPSFPQYVKIGYADNVESRLKQLNNSECIPFAFRIYATYEDLGAEAIRRLEVEDFPAVVIIDSEGNNLYETGRQEYLDSLK